MPTTTPPAGSQELTWYSLRLVHQPPPGYPDPDPGAVYLCQTPRHKHTPPTADWTEMLLNLDQHTAWRVWTTCHACHTAMQITRREHA